MKKNATRADVIFNGKAYGDVADKLLQSGFDTSILRPWHEGGQVSPTGALIGGKTYITANQGGKLVARRVANATATLRKDDWKHLDDTIIKVAKPRLKAVADLRSAGLTYKMPNGMAKTVLETEAQSDIGPASISMDGLRENQNDRPVFELFNLPLPIIHKDFSYSARQLAASRTGGSPLDTTSAELAARRVAEEAEKLLLGNSTVSDQFTFGGGTIYGYTDFPDRATYSITAPNDSTWTGTVFLNDLLGMRQELYNLNYFGPYMVYLSPAFDQYIDGDHKAASDKSIRMRAKEIGGINDIRTLDYLTGYQIIMVQMTSDVVREVVGMEMTTVQWDETGGLLKNFKVMAILVPQIRSDQSDQTGLCHGS